MRSFIFEGSLADLDSDVFKLSQLEEERQFRKLILIPSESQAPLAILEALGSSFQNIYAEGYPDEESRGMSEAEIMDFELQLNNYRRYSDPRYYKGVEYADIIEELARRRVAELFSNQKVAVEDIFVNVQALSGAPANNAVYHALINPGDTILGMSLSDGGHLSHGSPVNRSGKLYHAVHYSVDKDTEKIDYQAIESIAKETKPKVIIAGFSSYPWKIDWLKFKEISNSVGAYLLADISHVAGLVAAGVYPTPVGIADVVTFTTHKTLCGPRGACILTFDLSLSRKIDRAVFPGEQGGPHINNIAGIAVAMKLAKTKQFQDLQQQIVLNCSRLCKHLEDKGFRIPFGGTDTHLMNLDCSSIHGKDGITLSGDQAARILDLAGLVVNRNTIPGDLTAGDPSGIRMGTTWVTQRGFDEPEIETLAKIISDLLTACIPFSLEGRKGGLRRAKISFEAMENGKQQVRELIYKTNNGKPSIRQSSYPHFFSIDDQIQYDWCVIKIDGEKAKQFLNFCIEEDIDNYSIGAIFQTKINLPNEKVHVFTRIISNQTFEISIRKSEYGLVTSWLRNLSDGFITFGTDLRQKLPGPVSIRKVDSAEPSIQESRIGEGNIQRKPFYIGITDQVKPSSDLEDFIYESEDSVLQRTELFGLHKKLGAKLIPFAGWEMPVWYSSVAEEHQSVRNSAGIFDVSHMGVFQAEGPDADIFLDSVVANDIGSLRIGQSCYTHFLDPDANVIDDLLIYRRAIDKYMLVVNASNDTKDWKWLNCVKDGKVVIDRKHPDSLVFGRKVILRNLRDPNEGSEMRVDIALQGPKSREILLRLGVNSETRQRIMKLRRTELCEAMVGEFNLIVSRTGYTGEKMAFELFVHPDRSVKLFETLLDVGNNVGLKPIGLGARDSLRTEAGLPLYGHEMGLGSGKRGSPDLGVSEAGFGSYVKVYKPWFIGRSAYLKKGELQKGDVCRFQFDEKGVRMAHPGDPILDRKGKVIGFVTSCSINGEGYLLGQAFLNNKYIEEGTKIFVFQSAPEKINKTPAELLIDDKFSIPSSATVISRFLK